MLTTDVVSFIIISAEEMHMSKYIGTVITALLLAKLPETILKWISYGVYCQSLIHGLSLSRAI